MNLSGPIALVTAAAARNLDEDLPPLESALKSAGAKVQIVDWDADADWSQYRIAVLRSTWDYSTRIAEFLAWADRVSAQTQLVNSAAVVRWNTDKHYLAFLIGAAVPTVASEFIEPGQDANVAVAGFFERHDDAAELVVKPAIGSGSRDAQRYPRNPVGPIVAHAERLLAAKRSVLLQPYLQRVDDSGETALIYFAGEFSHAVRKGALLKPGTESTRALFAPEVIAPRTPAADELRLGGDVLATVPFDDVMYARVDLIRDGAGAPRVLEVELTEPSLFFAYGPNSAQKFAATILHWSGKGDRNRPARD